MVAEQKKLANQAYNVSKTAKAKRTLTTNAIKTNKKGESHCFIYKEEDNWAKRYP